MAGKTPPAKPADDKPSTDDKPSVNDQVTAAADAADQTATKDQRRAAEKRKASIGSPDVNAGMIAALLEERRGYVQRDLKDRVEQVDEQLRLRGAEPPTE